MKTRSARLGVITGSVVVIGLGVAVATPAVRRASEHDLRADTALASQSIATFEQRLREDPWNYVVAGRVVDRYMERFRVGADLDDVRRAEAVARSVRPYVADQATAHARLSVVLVAQHKFAEAYEAAAAAVAADSADQSAWGVMYDAALATGRYAEAESALSRLQPGTMVAQLRHARWFAATGDEDNAYYAMARACRDIERSSLGPSVLAWCLTELGRIEHGRVGVDSAEALFRLALRAQPGYRGAVEGLADLASAGEEWKEAIELYRRIAVDAHPDLYLRLMEGYAALRDNESARRYEAEFRRVAEDPASKGAYALPLALYYANEPATLDSAVAILERELQRRRNIEVFDVLSWVQLQRGALEAALAASDSARSWGAPTPTMDYHRGKILTALGRDVDGAALLRSALRDPSLLKPHVRWDATTTRSRRSL